MNSDEISNNKVNNICYTECQNQTLLAKMGFCVILLFNKNGPLGSI